MYGALPLSTLLEATNDRNPNNKEEAYALNPIKIYSWAVQQLIAE